MEYSEKSFKQLVVLFAVVIILTSSISCSTRSALNARYRTKNALVWRHRLYFWEHRGMGMDTNAGVILSISIDHNHPRIIDEEFWSTLTITFRDSTTGKNKKYFDLQKDTQVTTHYEYTSPWIFGDYPWQIKGQIKILKWRRKKVRLAMDLAVYYPNDTTSFMKYKGKRTFRGRGWNKK